MEYWFISFRYRPVHRSSYSAAYDVWRGTLMEWVLETEGQDSGSTIISFATRITEEQYKKYEDIF